MLFLITVFFLSFSLEAKNIYDFSNENLEKDFIELSQEVSCPLCAGSSIAESDSDIANDLKNAIFVELENGKTPKEIKTNLIKLYGEGILFMPENKISILLASHNMNEVTRLCKTVLMMREGIIIDRGDPEELIKKHGRKNLEEVFLKLSRSEDEFH